MRKNLKRILALTVLLVVLCATAIADVAPAQYTQAVAEEDGDISTRSDIIDWRYKTVDGRIHRRLYNYSRGVWIGEWEPC